MTENKPEDAVPSSQLHSSPAISHVVPHRVLPVPAVTVAASLPPNHNQFHGEPPTEGTSAPSSASFVARPKHRFPIQSFQYAVMLIFSLDVHVFT